jgi:hypothetical protein
MPVFSWLRAGPQSEGEGRSADIAGSPPDNDLRMLANYIAETERRWARQTARVTLMEEEGRDISRSERVLRDLEETLAVLRQRHRTLELDARSHRLLAATRESLSRSRPGPSKFLAPTS